MSEIFRDRQELDRLRQQVPRIEMPEQPPVPAGAFVNTPAPAPTTLGDTLAGALRDDKSTEGIGRDAILKAEQVLTKYRDGKASVDRRIIRSQQWWKLHNWEQIAESKGGRANNGAHGAVGSTNGKSNTAWLWNCIVGKHADLIDSYPEPLILPRMEDDKEQAKRLSEIVPVVLKLNEFEKTYNDCAWQKLIEGTAAYAVTWDQDKLNGLGDISIKKVSLLNLYWQPGITDIQDSANLFLVALVDKEQAEREYPQLHGKTGGTTLTVSKYRYDDNVDTSDKVLIVDWYYHTWRNGKKLVQFCKFCNGETLYSTENDPQLRDRGLYDDGLYPIVLDSYFPVEGSPAGYGLIDVCSDTQRDIDLLSQALVQQAAMNATPRYFVNAQGALNEEEFADFSKPIVHVQGSLDSSMLAPITVPGPNGNVVGMLNQKIEEIKFITGNTDVHNGSTPSGVTAASAIAALREDSGRTSKDASKASYRAFARIVNMVIERMRQFYDMPRQFRILGQRGEERFVSFDNSGIQPQPQGEMFGYDMGYRLPVFDVDVQIQRETSYSRTAQNELAIQLYQLGIFNPNQVDVSLMLLDMMDFKGKDELCQKLQAAGTMQQMLIQWQQIALALAQQYDPAMAEQLGAQIMGQAGMAAPQQARPVAPGELTKAEQQVEANGQVNSGNKGADTRVNRAAQQAADASRPS